MAWWITFHTFRGSLHPHVSTASVSKGWGGLEGRIGLPAFAASTLSLWVLRGRRGAWAPCISNILGL